MCLQVTLRKLVAEQMIVSNTETLEMEWNGTLRLQPTWLLKLDYLAIYWIKATTAWYYNEYINRPGM